VKPPPERPTVQNTPPPASEPKKPDPKPAYEKL
jgi:hypothetical protein